MWNELRKWIKLGRAKQKRAYECKATGHSDYNAKCL